MILTVKIEIYITILKTGLLITDINSVTQKKWSIFLEVRVPVVVRRKLI
jgi:hypothetical protein